MVTTYPKQRQRPLFYIPNKVGLLVWVDLLPYDQKVSLKVQINVEVCPTYFYIYGFCPVYVWKNILI